MLGMPGKWHPRHAFMRVCLSLGNVRDECLPHLFAYMVADIAMQYMSAITGLLPLDVARDVSCCCPCSSNAPLPWQPQQNHPRHALVEVCPMTTGSGHCQRCITLLFICPITISSHFRTRQELVPQLCDSMIDLPRWELIHRDYKYGSIVYRQ